MVDGYIDFFVLFLIKISFIVMVDIWRLKIFPEQMDYQGNFKLKGKKIYTNKGNNYATFHAQL